MHCQNCGSEIKVPGALYCPNCGSSLKDLAQRRTKTINCHLRRQTEGAWHSLGFKFWVEAVQYTEHGIVIVASTGKTSFNLFTNVEKTLGEMVSGLVAQLIQQGWQQIPGVAQDPTWAYSLVFTKEVEVE